MKVGILTFHNAHNYGAVLQAYALKRTIEILGNDVDIINYRNSAIEKEYDTDIKKVLGIKKKYFRNPGFLLYKIKEYKQRNYRKEAYLEKHRKFTAFINRYLLDGNDKVFALDDLKNTNYDAFIVGSDQVWNVWLTDGLDPVYLLDFKTSAKKISYSASRGNVDMPNNEKKYFTKCIKEFDNVSVREEILKNELIDMGIKNAIVTSDPTLLIEKNEYEDMLKDIDEKKYLLAYFVYENDEMMKIAKKIADDNQLKLIDIHYFLQKKYKLNNQLANIGPEEFLGYIKNAEIVITNSFHGTIFSIIFEKQFYNFHDEDMRIDGLINRLKIKSRNLKNNNIEAMQVIEYSKVKKEMETLREESIKYLVGALDI